jgi:hypothetical protein
MTYEPDYLWVTGEVEGTEGGIFAGLYKVVRSDNHVEVNAIAGREIESLKYAPKRMPDCKVESLVIGGIEAYVIDDEGKCDLNPTRHVGELIREAVGLPQDQYSRPRLLEAVFGK